MAGKEYITYPLSKVNLSEQYKHVFTMPKWFLNSTFCPVCGKKTLDCCYAIHVNETEYIKITGKSCAHCKAFFSTKALSLHESKNRYSQHNSFILHYDFFYVNSEFLSQDELIKNLSSAYRQYVLYSPHDVRKYIIVFDKREVDISRRIISANSCPEARRLLLSNVSSKIEIDNKLFNVAYIEDIGQYNSKEVLNDNVVNSIIYGDIPTMTSNDILYLYDGNIKCLATHHVSDFTAYMSPSLRNTIKFNVQYCYDCNKFLMRRPVYDHCLKKYGLIPMKISQHSATGYGYQALAPESILKISGYSANAIEGKSTAKRQSVLAQLMSYGILSKANIIAHLSWLVDLHSNDSRWQSANKKMKEDIEFVDDFMLTKQPKVLVAKIENRKK